MTIEKRALLLFSGGVDSTYQLQRNLAEQRGVDVLYVEGGQDPRKVAAERIARRGILAKLREMPDYTAMACEVEKAVVHSRITFGNSPSAGYAQAPAWFLSAFEAVDPRRHSEVQICYLAGDQIASVMDRMIRAWETLWDVFKIGPMVPLTFPLRHDMKSMVLAKIRPELYHLAWVCERPMRGRIGEDDEVEYWPCWKCEACVGREVEALRLQRLRDKVFPDDKWTAARKRGEEEIWNKELVDGSR